MRKFKLVRNADGLVAFPSLIARVTDETFSAIDG